MLALALTAMLLSVSAAFAHASLLRAEPADRSVVPSAPQRLTLIFNEPVSPLVLKLIHADGTAFVLDRYTLHDTTLEIEAPTGLGNGTQVLSWRVISADGHPVGGSVLFSIGAPTTGSLPDTAETIDWPLRVGIWTGKLALYAGLFLGVGGAFFRAWLASGSVFGKGFVVGATLLGLIAAPLSIGPQGLDALGMPLSGIAQPIAWKAGFDTSYGITATIAELALVFALVSLAIRNDITAKILSLAGIVGVGIALAASGHASAAHPQWLTRPAVFLHAVGVAFWAGALGPLGALLASRSPDRVIALSRFSRAIPVVLVPLIGAGIVLAVVQLEGWSALIDTAYGRVFLVKLALVVMLLVLAAINRWRLTGPARQGERVAMRRLARMIAVETVLVVAIFGVAALWRFTPPPRALAAAAAAPAAIHIHTAKAMAELSIAPGRAGPVSASILLMTGDFAPLDAKEVTLILSNPDAGIEPIRCPAMKADDGAWRVGDLTVPLPGRWSVRVEVLISDFEMVRLEDAIDIKP
ncbi:copper transport protein [Rhizobiales bacterium GAS191]|nr:copper transport protein [Rhizobiales bacterium GAS191]